MTSRRKTIAIVSACAGFITAAFGSAQAYDGLSLQVQGLQLMGQRQYILDVNRRCQILAPERVEALTLGFLQARNASIRAGADMARISPVLARAYALASTTNCQSPDLQREIEVLNSAYAPFTAQTALELQGSKQIWRAKRAYGQKQDWRLVQEQRHQNQTYAFGLYGTLKHKELSLVSYTGAEPISARLLIRNPNALRQGLISALPYRESEQRPFGFEDAFVLSFMAKARSQLPTNDADYSQAQGFIGLDRDKQKTGWRFDFPSYALVAIGPLDPREDIVVALQYAQTVRYIRFEVGDFIPGMIYVGLP
jgi:hypothetical protein